MLKTVVNSRLPGHFYHLCHRFGLGFMGSVSGHLDHIVYLPWSCHYVKLRPSDHIFMSYTDYLLFRFIWPLHDTVCAGCSSTASSKMLKPDFSKISTSFLLPVYTCYQRGTVPGSNSANALPFGGFAAHPSPCQYANKSGYLSIVFRQNPCIVPIVGANGINSMPMERIDKGWMRDWNRQNGHTLRKTLERRLWFPHGFACFLLTLRICRGSKRLTKYAMTMSKTVSRVEGRTQRRDIFRLSVIKKTTRLITMLALLLVYCTGKSAPRRLSQQSGHWTLLLDRRLRFPKQRRWRSGDSFNAGLQAVCNEDHADTRQWQPDPSLIPITGKRQGKSRSFDISHTILYRGSICFSPFSLSTTFTFLLSKLGDSCTDNTILQLGCAICVICMGSLQRKGGSGNLDFVESSEFEIYKKNM